MTERNHPKSTLELKAERFLEHDSLLSDSDNNTEGTNSFSSARKTKKKQKNQEERRSNKSSARKLRTKRSTKAELPGNSNEHRSKSRSRKEKSIVSLRSPRAVDAPANISSLKDNYSLRIKISDLSKTVNKKNKRIKKLYDNIFAEKERIRELTLKSNDLTKKSGLLEEFQQKIHTLQKNELNLIEELTDQQKISKDALTRLYELQEQSAKDVEDAKRYYRDIYSQQTNEIKQQLEDRITLVSKEKDNLVATIKNTEALRESERINQINELNHEVISLKDKLISSESDVERLRHENKDLRRKLQEQEDRNDNEKALLRDKIDELAHRNQVQKSHEEEHFIKEASEKTKLHRKIESLEKDLAERDKTIKTKDREYKDQLELINTKVQSLQKEVKRMGEYEDKVDTLQKELSTKEKELDLAKQYYKEKLAARKKVQSEHKDEWSGIYSELITEIKGLKTEIDSLGAENKKLLVSYNSRAPIAY